MFLLCNSSCLNLGLVLNLLVNENRTFILCNFAHLRGFSTPRDGKTRVVFRGIIPTNFHSKGKTLCASRSGHTPLRPSLMLLFSVVAVRAQARTAPTLLLLKFRAAQS